MNVEPEKEMGFGGTAAIRGGGSRAATRHEELTGGLAVMLHVQAVTESTGPGHSPGVGHLTSKGDDFQPTEPGHSPGVGHSTGPEVMGSPSHL